MPFAMIDGRRIEVRMIPGPAARPTLVFVHEGLGCVELWRDFPDKLARTTGCPTLLYSRFGYGRSDGFAARRDVAFMHREALDVLPELLRQLCIARPILVGHSDGASIALIHASHPASQIVGLVLMAPHVFVESMTVASIARIAESYVTSGLRVRLARYHNHVDDAFRGWSDIWLSPEFRSWSLAPEVAALNVPTLLIQGENDEYGSLAQLDAFSAALDARVSRVVLPNCGHTPFRDQEAAVITAIAEFAAVAGSPHCRAPAGKAS